MDFITTIFFLKFFILARGLAHANKYLITENQNDKKKIKCWCSVTVFNSLEKLLLASRLK